MDFNSLSGAADKSFDTPNEQTSVPRERKEMTVDEATASSTTEGSRVMYFPVSVQPLQPIIGREENKQGAPAVEEQQAGLISTSLEDVLEHNMRTPQQQYKYIGEGEVNETTYSTIGGNDTAFTALPGPHQQLVAQDEENQEVPMPMYFSSTSTTGLDVDSNQTETSNSDNDSAIGNSVFSSTFSTRSSLYDFVQENGRTYHRFKEGKYHLPNDEVEMDRLDLQHHLCNLSFGSLYLAPIDNLSGGLHNVLDIATGTGIWAIEFAAQFPSAVVKGTDLSPIQPEYVPPNCHFEVDDAEDTWVFSHKFDYIHGRMLVTCFQSHLAVFKSAFESLRSGGYIELQDASFPFLGADDRWNGSAFQRWMGLLMDGAKALGKDWNRVPRYKGYLEELGFVDVVECRFDCPIGPWARGKKNKTLGIWGRANILSSLGALSMAVMTKGLGMTVAEIELLLVDVRKDINKSGNQSIYLYAPMYVVYGRKP